MIPNSKCQVQNALRRDVSSSTPPECGGKDVTHLLVSYGGKDLIQTSQKKWTVLGMKERRREEEKKRKGKERERREEEERRGEIDVRSDV